MLQHIIQPCLLLLLQLMGPEDGAAPGVCDAAEEASHLGETYAVLERVGPLVTMDDGASAEQCAARAAAVRTVLAGPGGEAAARAALRWRAMARTGNDMAALVDSRQLLQSLLLNPCSKVGFEQQQRAYLLIYFIHHRARVRLQSSCCSGCAPPA